jgi:hypothetical protein
LELGPGFQGGAITNLTLAGIELTNQLSTTLPVNGMFTVMNSGGTVYNYGSQLVPTGVYGNYTVTGGGMLSLSNSDMHGAVSVANDGTLKTSRATMYGPVTVANGGLMTVIGGGSFNSGSSLTLAAGSTLNMSGGITLYGPLNNAGTINMSNQPPSSSTGFVSYNDGSATYQGGVVNQASGLINLNGDGTYSSIYGLGGGQEYLVNKGQIIKTSGTNISAFLAPFTTNSGAITVQSGKISLRPFVTQPGDSLNVVLNNATNYGSFLITSNIVLAGAFNATLSNGYVPANGTSFSVFSVSSPEIYSGTFTSLGLPAAVSWQSSYGATNFTLVAGSAQPQFGTFNLSGTNLIFNGIGGSPGSNYVVLASTNLTLPLTNWSALSTNTFDGSGQFHYTNPVSPAKPLQFFIFKSP